MCRHRSASSLASKALLILLRRSLTARFCADAGPVQGVELESLARGVLTTFTSYGAVGNHRQREIIGSIGPRPYSPRHGRPREDAGRLRL